MLKDSHPGKVVYQGAIGKDEVGEVLQQETEKVSDSVLIYL